MTVINPEQALISIREKLEREPMDLHWLVKKVQDGYLFTDSGNLLISLGYGGINAKIKHKMEARELTAEETATLFQKFLDWLALNVPQSKTWGIQFMDGCEPVPCDRLPL